MTIKLIAIDIDGTLLNSKRELTQKTIDALRYAHERGLKIVLCTGRPYLAMKDLVPQIGISTEEDYIITFNGGLVHSAKSGKVVVSNTIPTEDMLLWYEHMEALELPLNVIDSTTIYEPLEYPAGKKSQYVERTFSTVPTKQVDFNSFPKDYTFNKMVVGIDEDYLDEKIPLMDPALLARFSVFKSRDFLLEIVALGVNKANTLMQLGNKLGITADEMMTIGDQENDLTMIEMAGIGVAMGNAIERLKEAADYVTADYDHDGVAQAIYHLIK